MRLRARLGLLALWIARKAFGVSAPTSDPDWTHCKWCGADCGDPVSGLPGDEAPDHAADCPAATGIYPVALRDCFPHGVSHCTACGCPLWPGDHYSLVQQEAEGVVGGVPVDGIAIYMQTCTGCAVLAGAAKGPKDD